MPSTPWTMFQKWESLLFTHWRLPADTLRTRIPSSLTLDTYRGDAWLTITPFLLTGLHARGLPPIPLLSEFPEVNLRTYVTRDGKPGVWFFSLDAGSIAAVTAARAFYRLPYFHADMRVERGADGWVAYSSVRRPASPRMAGLKVRYRPSGASAAAEPGSLDHWLAERYCLYAGNERTLLRAEIDHAPWSLQPAEIELETNTLAAAAGFRISSTPDRCASALPQDVVIWWPDTISSSK